MRNFTIKVKNIFKNTSMSLKNTFRKASGCFGLLDCEDHPSSSEEFRNEFEFLRMQPIYKDMRDFSKECNSIVQEIKSDFNW